MNCKDKKNKIKGHLTMIKNKVLEKKILSNHYFGFNQQKNSILPKKVEKKRLIPTKKAVQLVNNAKPVNDVLKSKKAKIKQIIKELKTVKKPQKTHNYPFIIGVVAFLIIQGVIAYKLITKNKKKKRKIK